MFLKDSQLIDNADNRNYLSFFQKAIQRVNVFAFCNKRILWCLLAFFLRAKSNYLKAWNIEMEFSL